MNWSLPPGGAKGAGIKAAEMKMAEQLVERHDRRSGSPKTSRTSSGTQVMKLVDRKVKAGDTESVFEPEEAPRRMAPKSSISPSCCGAA